MELQESDYAFQKLAGKKCDVSKLISLTFSPVEGRPHVAAS